MGIFDENVSRKHLNFNWNVIAKWKYTHGDDDANNDNEEKLRKLTSF